MLISTGRTCLGWPDRVVQRSAPIMMRMSSMADAISPTSRSHVCTDQPANVKKTLANSEPPQNTEGTYRGNSRMSALRGIVLQKSPRRGWSRKIRNNRIGANGFLNQRCASTPDLESILRARMGKIVLQHNQGLSGRAEHAAPRISAAIARSRPPS